MRNVVSLAIAAGIMLLAACNTVEGMGKDVSSAGTTVANAADKSK